MIAMLIVASGLGLIVGGMLFHDSLERRLMGNYEPSVSRDGGENQLMTGLERDLARKLDLETFRSHLEELERRLTLKICLINAVAVAVVAALVRCMK